LYPKAGHLGLPFLSCLCFELQEHTRVNVASSELKVKVRQSRLLFAKRGLSNIMSLPFSYFSYFPQHSGHCHCKGKSHLQ
jgi:hypothetical protein